MKLNTIEITKRLIDHLWEKYCAEVAIAGKADRLLKINNYKINHDHILFRTLKTHCGEQPEGIESIAHLAGYFGYSETARYSTHHKLITNAVYKNRHNGFPDLLISQFEVNHLPGWTQKLIGSIVEETPYLISDNGIELLGILKETGQLPVEACNFLLADLSGYFCRTWDAPGFDAIQRINEVSSYCAWVLLFGNSPRRISISGKSFNELDVQSFESVCDFLFKNGIPVTELPQLIGFSFIRQAATEEEKIYTDVVVEEGMEKIRWDYSHFHITSRSFDKKNENPVNPGLPLFPD